MDKMIVLPVSQAKLLLAGTVLAYVYQCLVTTVWFKAEAANAMLWYVPQIAGFFVAFVLMGTLRWWSKRRQRLIESASKFPPS